MQPPTREEHPLLERPVLRAKRIAAVHDDLGVAIGRDRLRDDLAGGPLEPPQPLDVVPQRGGGQPFAVNQGG